METLRELFRYHAWATLGLIDGCMALSGAALRETAPGTFGTLIETFVHLVAAEQRYLSRLPGGSASATLREGMEPPLAELRAIVVDQGRRWQALLDRGAALDVTMPPLPDGWPETPHAETLLMLQSLHHGQEHRTQIGTILGANCRTGPANGGWEYWERVHLSHG